MSYPYHLDMIFFNDGGKKGFMIISVMVAFSVAVLSALSSLVLLASEQAMFESILESRFEADSQALECAYVLIVSEVRRVVAMGRDTAPDVAVVDVASLMVDKYWHFKNPDFVCMVDDVRIAHTSHFIDDSYFELSFTLSSTRTIHGIVKFDTSNFHKIIIY